MMEQTVEGLMTPLVLTCPVALSLQEAARMMTERAISALVVVDERGALAGILSRTDVVNARLYAQYWKHWRGLTVGQVMSASVTTVGPAELVEHAGRLMVERKVGRLVVVEPGPHGPRPVGILSITDIVREIAAEQE